MPDVLPEPSLYAEALADCASATRHDGWTRQVKVTFCEVLAITGRVIEALDAVNKSGNTAYAQRRRDPLFAQAWDMALAAARHRLADVLLTRALDGDLIVRTDAEGQVVSERRLYDNRLALAVLRRLDRIAETGRATALPRAAAAAASVAANPATPAASTDVTSANSPAAAPMPAAFAPCTLEAALDLLAAGPPEPPAGETHETHTPLSDLWVGGQVKRAVPPHLAAEAAATHQREFSLSHMC